MLCQKWGFLLLFIASITAGSSLNILRVLSLLKDFSCWWKELKWLNLLHVAWHVIDQSLCLSQTWIYICFGRSLFTLHLQTSGTSCSHGFWQKRYQCLSVEPCTAWLNWPMRILCVILINCFLYIIPLPCNNHLHSPLTFWFHFLMEGVHIESMREYPIPQPNALNILLENSVVSKELVRWVSFVKQSPADVWPSWNPAMLMPVKLRTMLNHDPSGLKLWPIAYWINIYPQSMPFSLYFWFPLLPMHWCLIYWLEFNMFADTTLAVASVWKGWLFAQRGSLPFRMTTALIDFYYVGTSSSINSAHVCVTSVFIYFFYSEPPLQHPC